MKSVYSPLFGLLLLSLPGCAQEAEEACTAQEFQLADAEPRSEDSSALPSPKQAKRTEVTDAPLPHLSHRRQRRRRLFKIALPRTECTWFIFGPWGSNSQNELKNGWADLVTTNPEVTFPFVTVWNDNESGASALEQHDLRTESQKSRSPLSARVTTNPPGDGPFRVSPLQGFLLAESFTRAVNAPLP